MIRRTDRSTQTGTTGFQFTSTLSYDEATDTMTNTENDTVFKANDNDTGFFEAEDGTSPLPVGWRVGVGFDNFVKGFSDERYAHSPSSKYCYGT